jgi:hypothetical protein
VVAMHEELLYNNSEMKPRTRESISPSFPR